MSAGTGYTRVLVVDDDDTIRQLVGINLLAEGLQVTSARDGHEAAVAAWTDPPDLIVLDVMMPGIDGLELLRQLRADPRTEHIPVILLTACSTDQQVWAGWSAGADYYLTKPFDVDQLLDVIEEIGRSAPADAPIDLADGSPGSVPVVARS